MKDVIIVVPIYKEVLNQFEKISLIKLDKVLGNHPIKFILPRGLSLINYPTLINKYEFLELEEKYFRSISGYNSLMLSEHFYRQFVQYRYILIHQLDCFVFSDQLIDFCKLGLDYIGAPWPVNEVKKWYKKYPVELKLLYKILNVKLKPNNIGNGGLSLRRTSSMINNVRLFNLRLKRLKLNEDVFFSHYVSFFNPFFRKANEEIAVNFSVDKSPNIFLTKYNLTVPFACHGWSRNDTNHYRDSLLFWGPIIKKYGYELP